VPLTKKTKPHNVPGCQFGPDIPADDFYRKENFSALVLFKKESI